MSLLRLWSLVPPRDPLIRAAARSIRRDLDPLKMMMIEKLLLQTHVTKIINGVMNLLFVSHGTITRVGPYFGSRYFSKLEI